MRSASAHGSQTAQTGESGDFGAILEIQPDKHQNASDLTFVPLPPVPCQRLCWLAPIPSSKRRVRILEWLNFALSDTFNPFSLFSVALGKAVGF